MSDFDFDKYINSKLNDVDFASKVERVIGGSADKTARLEAQNAEEIARQKSWAGRAGFDTDDFIGARINDVASVVSGGSRLVGQIASLAPNALSMLQTAGNSSADYAAQRASTQGKPLLNSEKRAVENFQRADELRKAGRATNNFFDLTGIVDQTNRNQLNTDLTTGVDEKWDNTKKAWKDGHVGDAVAGLSDILMQAGSAIVSNPGAAKEYILENAPQIFVGAAGVPGAVAMAASNVGYAADEYQKGIENYMAKNGGALPPDDLRHTMAIQAASLAVAEHAGDHAIVAASKAKKLFGGAVEGAADAAKTGVVQGAKNTLKAAAESGLTEAATEGYQTGVENTIEGKDNKFSDILAGAVIGGVAGAGNSGAVRALSEVTGKTPEKVQAKQEAALKEVTDKQAVQEAVKEANPDKFLDPKTKDYSPHKGISVMMDLAAQEGTTPEQHQEYLKKASEVIDRLEIRRDLIDPKKVKQQLAEAKDALKSADPTDSETIADHNDEINGLQAQLDDMSDPKKAQKYKNDLTIANKHLTEAQAVYEGFFRMATPSPSVGEVQSNIESADSADTEVASKAGEALINLSMTSHEEVAPDTALKLADNADNGLKPEQRDYLRKFSEARTAENELKKLSDVSKEVLYGKEGRYVGISQYRERIGQAVASNNEGRATRQLAQMKTFVDDHTAKLHMAETVPNGSQVVKNTDTNTWEVKKGERLSDRELRENGGFNIHHNSTRLIDGIQKEVTALTLAHAQLSQAVGMRFGKAAVQSKTSTQAAPTIDATPLTSSSLSREKGEREEHLESGKPDSKVQTPETVVSEPQKTAPVENKPKPIRSEKYLAAQAAVAAKEAAAKAAFDSNASHRAKGKEVDSSVASPSATLPVAAVADAPSARATASATAVGDKVEYQGKEQTIAQTMLHPSDGAPLVSFVSNPQKFVYEADVKTTNTTTQPVATEQQAEAPAKAQAAEVATAEEQDNSTPIGEAGRLSSVAGFKEDTRPRKEQYADPTFNPVAQFINQKSTDDTYKTVRPLVRIKDFLSKLSGGVIDQFTGLIGREPNEDDIRALEHFRKTAMKWNPFIRSNIGQASTKEADFDFRFRDMMQYMVSRDGDKVTVDENLLTAVSYGAYHYATDTASSPRMTTEKINAMFGRDEDASVDRAIWKHIKGMDNFEDILINNMGDSILQSLGLQLRPNAPQDVLPRIKTALGAHALLVLEKAKLIERRPVRRADIVENLAPLKDEKDNGNAIVFVFPNYEKLENYREANKGTSNVVDKLMTADQGTTFATTAPVKFSQKFAQRTQQEIPEVQRKAMDQLHKTPHSIVPEMFHTLKGLGEDNLLRIAGALNVETDHVHAANVESVDAQNRNLRNQLDLMLEMLGVTDVASADVDSLASNKYFVQGEVWKNFRAGISTRSLNQQTSKIHRYMFARPQWTVNVDLTNQQQHDDLLIAFAAGLGMKTDEKVNSDTITDFYKKISEPKTSAAIDAMRAGLFKNDWSNAEAITAYAADNEGMMTLQTLAMMAKWENANRTGKIDVTLLTGADGKTNGPILTHLALGAADSTTGLLKMMERGGMYAHGEGNPTHYSESRQAGLKDLYEDLASTLVSKIEDSPQMAALESIIGKLKTTDGSATKDGRSLVKTPLTAFAFGSSMKGSVLAMENKFISDVYAKIEKLSAKGESPVEFVRALNILTKFGNPNATPTIENIDIKALLGRELDPKDELALRAAFQELMADPVKKTMETYFATFIQRRSDLNTVVNSAHKVYDAAYKAMREAMVQKLMDSGEIAHRIGRSGAMKGKMLPLHDLTVEQEKTLRAQVADLLPQANTAYTVKDNNVKAGLYMAKSDAELSENSLHQTQITATNQFITAGTGEKKFSNKLSTQTMVRSEKEPGVAGTPYFIHSLDSANMHMSLLDVQGTLNVHDEAANNVFDIKNAAQAINKATVENLLAFSPPREALNMLERMVIAAAKGAEAGTITPEAINTIFSEWATVIQRQYDMKKMPDVRTAARMMFGMALDNAVKADTLRLETIAQLGNIDQYVWEGGQFEVTQAIRDEAQDRLKNMVKKMSPEAANAMTTLLKFHKGELKAVEKTGEQPDAMPTATAPIGGAAIAEVVGKSVTQETVNDMAPIERAEVIQKAARAEQAMPGTNMTPFGTLGVPTKVESNIRAAFADKSTLNRAEVVRLLADNLKGGYREILAQVAKALPANLTVNMISKDSDPKMVTSLPHDNSRGWFAPTTAGDNNIYILSDEFINSGLNAETLLHELVHAATAREILNPTDKASKSLISDLTNLVEHLKQQDGADKFGHILNGENALHELVAWGMSNKAFQAWMSGIGFKSKTTTNRLTTAFKEFVRILTGGRYNGTALEALLRNTAGLMGQSAQNTSEVAINLSQVAPPDSYTTQEIFDALASPVNPLAQADEARIKAVMLRMVEKLAPIYGVFGKDVQTKTLSAQSIYASAVAPGGIAPFANDALAHGLGYNEQVSFMLEQVQAVMQAAVSGDDGQSSLAYAEMTKLWEEAADKMKGVVSDDMYNFMFNVKADAADKSDYISRFVALGLIHPEVNAAMQFNTKIDGPKVATSFTERVSMVFDQILDWITGRWTQTHAGQRADSKLDTLATQLVKIEAKRRARLNVQQNATAAAIEQTFRGVADKARDKLNDVFTSDFFKGSNNGYVRFTGMIGSTLVKDKLDGLLLAYQTFSDTHFKNSQGTAANVLNEMQGAKKDNQAFYNLSRITKFLEGKRKDLISMTSKVLVQSFANKGKDLTDDHKKAISAVFLRTDMSKLLDAHGLDGLLTLMKDKSARVAAISAAEQELASNRNQLFYLNAAESMAYHMATGEAATAHVLMNSYAIARLAGTQQSVAEADAAKVEPIIDRLASLYAMDFVNNLDMKNAIEVLATEMARTKEDAGNGIELTLRLHDQLQQQSKDRLFKEQQALMVKGYVPEIYNHYIEVQTADSSEAADLKDQGYGEGMAVGRDPHDPDTSDKMLFARHGSGLMPYLSGAVSLKSMQAKGSVQHNGNTDLFTEQGQYNSDLMAHLERQKAGAIADMFTKRIHPAQSKQSFMVPVINPAMKTVNYRYMMKNRTKDQVLMRDNRFDQLLGSMAGSIFDKEASPKHNRTIVEALKAQYDEDFKTRAVSYREVGPRSPDPKLREIYRMLPEETKSAIRDVWKSDSMQVRTDLMDINFGYRKMSITDTLRQNRDAREGFNKFLAEILSFIGGGPLKLTANMNEDDKEKRREVRDQVAIVRLRNAEEIWQAFVKEAKDMIVIKSGSTLVGNVLSNFSLLYAYGVPVMDMMRHHRVALRGAVAYNRDSEELFTLQTKLDTGLSQDAAKDTLRVAQLKDKIARNPVKELIDAGLMPTIVEDVDVDDDIYSIKSRFIKRVEAHTGKLNPHVMSLGKTLYMAHDTKLYKFMSEGASMSDFLARYTLYQYQTTKKNPMAKDAALQLASDAFINYDVPTDRKLQYANDMGFVRFTKYYLRIQKVIFHLYKENPARMMSLMAMHHFFPAVDTVLNSSMMNRLGRNPLDWGAFEFVLSFDDLMSSKAVGLPFR